MHGVITFVIFLVGLGVAVVSALVMYLIIDERYKYKEQEKRKALKLLWIPVLIGLLMSIPMIRDIADSPSTHSYVCDYCGKTSEHSFTVGKQDLCYDCYQLYKKGK